MRGRYIETDSPWVTETVGTEGEGGCRGCTEALLRAREQDLPFRAREGRALRPCPLQHFQDGVLSLPLQRRSTHSRGRAGSALSSTAAPRGAGALLRPRQCRLPRAGDSRAPSPSTAAGWRRNRARRKRCSQTVRHSEYYCSTQKLSKLRDDFSCRGLVLLLAQAGRSIICYWCSPDALQSQ